MNKSKSSKCAAPQVASSKTRSTLLQMHADIAEVKPSNNGKTAKILMYLTSRSLKVEGEKVSSMTPFTTIGELVQTANSCGWWGDDDRCSIRMLMNSENDQKIAKVTSAKYVKHRGNNALKLNLSTEDLDPTGATATEAVDLADINQGDTVFINMVSNITIPIPEDQSKIIDYIEKTSSLSTLETAIEAAGLDEALLAGIAVFTFFAPNDDAFKKLPAGALPQLLEIRNKEKLGYLLQGHLVKGRYTASDLVKLAKKRGNLVAVNGVRIPLKLHGDKLRIGYDSAEVALADIGASNGTVHIIKQVLIHG